MLALLALLACAHKPPPAAPRPAASRPAEGAAWPPTLHEARRYYLLGLLLAEAGDLEGAERALDRAAIFDPDSPGMALGFGRELAALGQWERAEPYLRDAAARGAGAPAWAALIALYLELDLELDARAALGEWAARDASPAERRERAGYRLRLGDAAGAAEDLAAWLAVEPGDEAALAQYLRAAGRARLWAGALDLLGDLAEAAPGSVAIWRARAQVAAHVGDEALAAEAAERWDALSGGDPEAVMERARSVLRRGDAQAAGALLERLRGLGGGADPERSSLEAGLLALAGDEEGARALLIEALARRPGERVLSLRLAELEADAGDLPAAAAALAGAEGLTEGSRARIEARFLVHAGDRAGAERRLREALDGGEPAVALTLAGVLIDGGEPERAIALLEGILAREHPPPAAAVPITWRLALALDAAGRREEALDRALYTLELDGDHREAMAYVGLRYAAEGRYPERAAAYLRLAIEADPTRRELMDALRRVDYQWGSQEAPEWLERAVRPEPGG